MTEWRTIPSYPDFQASAEGHIRRRVGVVHGKKAGDLLCEDRSKKGYLIVTLRVNGRSRRRGINRLVCEAFHGHSPDSGMHAAHNNGRPADNRPGNLRWATVSENHLDKRLHGTATCGVRNAAAKLTAADVGTIRRMCAAGTIQSVVANLFGIVQPHVSRIVRRASWEHINA